MVKLAYLEGLRIHEVARLEKSQLVNALKEGILTVKGKGGLVRNIPLYNKELVQRLCDDTKNGDKVFINKEEQIHKVINNLQVFIYNHNKEFSNRSDRNLTIKYCPGFIFMICSTSALLKWLSDFGAVLLQ